MHSYNLPYRATALPRVGASAPYRSPSLGCSPFTDRANSRVMTHAGDTEGSLPTTAAIRLVLEGLLERRPQLPAMRAGLPKSLAVLLALTMSLVACASRPPVVRKQLPSAVISHEREVLSAELVAQALGERARHAYKVGPGDTLV